MIKRERGRGGGRAGQLNLYVETMYVYFVA